MTAITSGNSATNIAVTAADPLIVEHGATATTPTISIGGIAQVSGVVVSGTVLSGGSLQIMSGGVASTTTISSEGLEVVSSGGLESGAIVQSFGIIDIASGGVASAIQLNAGADPTYYDSNGYTSDDANVVNLSSATSASGPLAATVESGGLLNSATVGDASVIVSSGGSAANIIMQSATISGDAQNNGAYATITVSSGGSISNVSAGDNDQIYECGSETNVTIGGNGAYSISTGNFDGRETNTFDALESPDALARYDTVSSGATLLVLQGSAFDTKVTDGGWFAIDDGVASGITLVTSNSNTPLASLLDAEANFAGGTTSNVIAHYAYLCASGSSTTVTDVTIDSSGQLNVDSQGTVLSATLTDGASATVSGGALLQSGSAAGSGTSLIVSGATISDFRISDSGTATVSSGGLLKQTILDTNASASVLSGGQTVSTTLSSSTSEEVASGGMATATDLLSGGMLSIDVGAGFAADGTVVNSGAAFTVNSGVTVQNTIISRGGNVFVLSGGTVSATVLASADTSSGQAFMDVESGATAFDTQINPGAIVYIESGAVDNGTIIGGSPSAVRGLQVMLGGTSYNLQVLEDGFLIAGQQGTAVELYNPTASGNQATLYVDVHATEYGGVVKDGGKQILYGVVSGLTVSNGGVQNILSVALVPTQASAVGDIIDSGGQVLQDGGYVENAVISSGGILSQTSGIASQYGGVAIATQIMDGGSAIIGTIGSATIVSSGGTEVIQSGGLESGGTVSDGLLAISSGGSAVHVTLSATNSSAMQLSVKNGGVVSGAIIESYAVAAINGSAVATTVNDGGSLRISSGGTASGTIVSGPTIVPGTDSNSPGRYQSLIVSSGGSASDTTVFHDLMVIDVGGSASGITLNDAGIVIQGTAYDVTANSQNGAYRVRVANGGIASGVATSNAVRTLVYDDGVIYNDTINSGGTEAVVGDGGMAATSYNADILSGGMLSGYYDNVQVISATVETGGLLEITSGAVASNASVGGLGGTMNIYSNGSAFDTQLHSGGLFTIGADSLSENTTVSSDSVIIISAGGIGSNTTVSAGGLENISSGSVESGGTISGGEMVVSSGGSAVDVTLSATTLFPPLYVESGGFISGVIVTDSAIAVISGSAAFTTIYDGGSAVLSSGAVAHDTTIIGPESAESVSNGFCVSSGGSAYNTVVTHGTISVMSGGYASGVTINDAGITVIGSADDITINYQNPAVGGYCLYIDHGAVSGVKTSQGAIGVYHNGTIYSDTIESGSEEDIIGTAEGSAASYNADILSGGKISAFGNSSAAVISTTVESGGLLDVSKNASATSATIGGSMTVYSNGSAIDTQVLSGGQLTIGDPSISENAIISSGGTMILSSGGIGSNTLIEADGQETVSSGSLESGGTVSGGLLTISSGGSAVLTTIYDGGLAVVSNGGVISNTNLSGPADTQAQNTTLWISAGGSAYGTTVFHDQMVVDSGACASSITLDQAGMTISGTVDDLTANAQNSNYYGVFVEGGTVSSATILSGTGIAVSDNGSIHNDTIGSNSMELLLSSNGGGATSYNADILSGGLLSAYDEDITVISATIEVGGKLRVTQNAVANAASVSGTMAVDSNGSATDTQILAGGMFTVGDPSLSENAIVSSGGTMILSSGGIGSNTLVEAGGQETVSSGSVESGGTVSGGLLTVSSGGAAAGVTLSATTVVPVLLVENGGSVSGTIVTQSAVAVISGLATNTTVYEGGNLRVGPQGVTSNTFISGPSDTESTHPGLWVSAGGSACDTTVFHDTMVLDADAQASGITLDDAGMTVKGTVDDITINYQNSAVPAYGLFIDGGTVSGVTGSRSHIEVYDNGSIYNDKIESGSVEYVYSASGAGTSYDADIQSGGRLSTFNAGAQVISATVEVGGTFQVKDQALADNTFVSGTMTINSNGSATDTQLLAGGQLTVGSGSLSDKAVVSSGGVMTVSSGAVGSATLVQSGGTETVLASGLESGGAVSGGTLIVANGATASSTLVANNGVALVSGSTTSDTISGGQEIVSSGGSASNAIIEGGGTLTVLDQAQASTVAVASGTLALSGAGASATSVTLDPDGQITLADGAVLNGTTYSAGTVTAQDGGTFESATLSDGAQAGATSGGTLSALTVQSGAQLTVSSGGVGSATQVQSGGTETVLASGLESGSTISGGLLTVSSGGSAFDVSVTAASSSVMLVVESGGLLSSVTVAASAVVNITGSAVSTTVHDDGVVAVTSGGVASNTVVSGSANPEGTNDSFRVSAGGTAYRTSVSHDIMVVDTGGLASGVTLTDAGLILQGSADNLTFSESNVSDYAVYVDGGTVTNLTTSNKATLVLDENGAISGNTIATGGTESIYGLSGSGGTVSGIDIQIDGMLSASGDNVDIVSVTVAMEGQLHITSGALVSSASVNGGTMYVADNGTTRDTQILTNGYLTLGDGGLSEETTLSSTGMMTVSSGAIGSDTLVEAGANEIVQAGGLESGGTVSGDLMIYGSGAKGAQISLLDSGTLDVAGSAVISGLNATNGTIRVETKAEIDDIAVQSGTLTVTGASIVSSGSLSGSASFNLASSALAQDLTLTNGTVTSVTNQALLSAARLASDTITTIVSTGSGYDLTVSGGQLIVSGGGLVSAATVTDMGDTHVYGGQVSSVTLAGGTMEIDDDGSAIATQVQSGGQFTVGDPSISENAVVSSGGVMTVSSGGIGSNTLVESGGQEIIFSGSLESGGTVSGGQEIVSSGGTTSDATIEGGGTLTVLDQAQANSVAVESGTLALSGASASATSVTLDPDGQITLADGAILSGGAYSAGTITAQDDGTFENATLSGAAQAGATSGGTISAVTVQSGARLTVSSGGVGQGVIVNSGAALQAEADATVDNTTIGSGALLRIDSATINSDTNLTSGGSIELLNTSWSETDTVNFSNDILTVDDNGTEIIINLSAADDVYLTRDFVLSQADTDPLYANSNDILVTLAPVACFCRGTLIETEFGPMLIENILEGTGILTLGGGVKALRWKGVRRYSHRQMALGAELRPLVIKADALNDGLPRRDLRVSQLHMLYIDGLFIPAAALINDRTIFIEQNCSEMDYYHLDIGTHNIIFSEGVATESLTDDDASRRGFDNYDQHVAALPSSADMVMAAPLIREGEVIATLQARYAWRAAILDVPLQRAPENNLLFL